MTSCISTPDRAQQTQQLLICLTHSQSAACNGKHLHAACMCWQPAQWHGACKIQMHWPQLYLAGLAPMHASTEAVKLAWKPAGAAMSVLQCLVHVACHFAMLPNASPQHTMDLHAQQPYQGSSAYRAVCLPACLCVSFVLKWRGSCRFMAMQSVPFQSHGSLNDGHFNSLYGHAARDLGGEPAQGAGHITGGRE